MKASVRIRFKPAEIPAAVVDASGASFDPEIHVAPDAITKAGLYRLKPGKSRK